MAANACAGGSEVTLAFKQWSTSQQDIGSRKVHQPFKVFRELYAPSELALAKRSGRYAGHQVNPRQAPALLGGRGWVQRAYAARFTRREFRPGWPFSNLFAPLPMWTV